jgi:GAF domain-containing protein
MIATASAGLVSRVQQICTQLEHREIDRGAFLSEITRLVTNAIGCSRTGLWIFTETAQGRILRCIGMYDGVQERMVLAPDETQDVEPYFLALEHTGFVVAPDVHDHQATAGLFAGRLALRGVRSLLAVSFSANGQLYGAFTCTDVRHRVEWSTAQLAMLRRIASRASVALFNTSRVTGTTDPMPLGDERCRREL